MQVVKLQRMKDQLFANFVNIITNVKSHGCVLVFWKNGEELTFPKIRFSSLFLFMCIIQISVYDGVFAFLHFLKIYTDKLEIPTIQQFRSKQTIKNHLPFLHIRSFFNYIFVTIFHLLYIPYHLVKLLFRTQAHIV